MQIVFECRVLADNRDVLSKVLGAISEEVKDEDLEESECESAYYDYKWSVDVDEEDEAGEALGG